MNAVERIYKMFDEETMELLKQNYAEEMDLPREILAQAIRDRAVPIYEYRASCDAGNGIDYYGKELFNQRAACILRSQTSTAECDHYSMAYYTELWLLEDASFMVVHAVVTTVVNDRNSLGCIAEYRTVAHGIKDADDIFFEPEDLICELDTLCILFTATKSNGHTRR